MLAVELFDVGGELLANEIAPRVHNSGHWTIEGAATSQFENHLRAVLGLPLGVDRRAAAASVMVNCIGAMPDRAAVLAVPGAHLHDYGKAPRAGRKVGHVTVVGRRRRTSCDARIDAVRRSGALGSTASQRAQAPPSSVRGDSQPARSRRPRAVGELLAR